MPTDPKTPAAPAPAPKETPREKSRRRRREIRKQVRGTAGCLLPLGLALLIGCATGTPGNKAPQTSADDNETTVISPIYVGVLPLGSNGVAMAGGVTFVISPGATLNIGATVHDVNGTISQAADVGGNDTTSQSATPTLQAGLTGDKPIEETAAVGKTALTAGASQAASGAGSLIEKGAQWAASKLTSTNAPAASASEAKPATTPAADCANGECAEPAAAK